MENDLLQKIVELSEENGGLKKEIECLKLELKKYRDKEELEKLLS